MRKISRALHATSNVPVFLIGWLGLQSACNALK
jgi:hypothetical protein